MKALSVKQPWAELEASGLKDLEIRSRATHYRGRLAIHASNTPDTSPAALEACKLAGYLSPRAMPLGRVVAVVNLTSCDPWEADADGQGARVQGNACTPWRPAAWAWKLTDARRADSPFPVKGQLGIWEIPDSAVTVQQPESVANGGGAAERLAYRQHFRECGGPISDGLCLRCNKRPSAGPDGGAS